MRYLRRLSHTVFENDDCLDMILLIEKVLKEDISEVIINPDARPCQTLEIYLEKS